MAERSFDGLFESLEATFEAAVDRADREAAADLALSLRQDRRLVDILGRPGWRVWHRTLGSLSLASVGTDYVETGTGELIPALHVVAFPAPSAPAPELAPESLRERLRGCVREGVKVRLEAGGRSFQGRLSSAGRDHLIVSTGQGDVVVGVEAIERISLGRGR